MSLAFVVSPQIVVLAGRPDDLQKEWQECRNVIGRLDGTLVDLRKYGFGLASTLLTANGVLGGIANLLPKSNGNAPSFTVPSAVIASLVAVTSPTATLLLLLGALLTGPAPLSSLFHSTQPARFNVGHNGRVSGRSLP